MAAVAYTDTTIAAGMMAVIASTSYAEAAALMRERGSPVSEATLRRWCKDEHVVRFEKLREAHAPRIEAQLANDLLSNARLAAETERLAIEAARTELLEGTAKEPAKIARDLSQVKAQSVDKRLALQGRPTQITERRDINEIVRALVGMNVARVAEPIQVADATARSVRPAAAIEPPQPQQHPQEPPQPAEPVLPEAEPPAEPKKRHGELVWSDELGEQVFESFD